MEIKLLERFLAVIDHGSLARAAKALGLTQQALSTSLANLEQDLGVRLFDRAPGGITRPTSYGQALVRHARSQLASAARARDELRFLSEGRTGTVTIGVGEAFAGNVIVAAVAAVRERIPDVRINLIEGYSELLRHRLYAGEFDFIAAGVSAFELAEEFTREQIYATDDVIVVGPEHPLARKRKLTLADLQGYAWLVPYSRPSDLNVIVEAFVSENLKPPTRLIGSDAYRIGMQLLTATDLLLMVSPALVGPELTSRPAKLVQLRIDRPTVHRNASLIYPRDRPMTAQAQIVLDEVRRFARELPKNGY